MAGAFSTLDLDLRGLTIYLGQSLLDAVKKNEYHKTVAIVSSAYLYDQRYHKHDTFVNVSRCWHLVVGLSMMISQVEVKRSQEVVREV
jgi:hypothetical protein